jgi:hypothetical protein
VANAIETAIRHERTRITAWLRGFIRRGFGEISTRFVADEIEKGELKP